VFIPCTDDDYDTSYFACRHAWGAADEQVHAAPNEYDDRSETSSMSCGSSPRSCDYEEDVYQINPSFIYSIEIRSSPSHFVAVISYLQFPAETINRAMNAVAWKNLDLHYR
jgi:hypothetical protein